MFQGRSTCQLFQILFTRRLPTYLEYLTCYLILDYYDAKGSITSRIYSASSAYFLDTVRAIMESKDPDPGRSLFLITYPRVASNLFVKILSLKNQDDVLTNDMGGYFFLPAFIMMHKAKLHDKHVDDWTEEESKEVKSLYQAGFDQLQAFIDRAQAEGKTLFVKEHANLMANPMKQSQYAWGRDAVHNVDWRLELPRSFGLRPQYSLRNDTVLPDSLLHQIRPTFLIRHPALVFPSNYRVSNEDEGQTGAAAVTHQALETTMTLNWSRRLYDFYAIGPRRTSSGSQPQPIIIDAYDVINAPRQLFPRFCALTGLDASKLSFTWQRMSDEARARFTQATGPAAANYFSTIWSSEGIMKEKAMHSSEHIDISLEARKWKEEFGEAEAKKLEEWVRRAMPDYTYMWERRLKPEPESKKEEEEEEGTSDVQPSSHTMLERVLSVLRSVRSRAYELLGTPKALKDSR